MPLTISRITFVYDVYMSYYYLCPSTTFNSKITPAVLLCDLQGKATEGEYRSAKRNKQHIISPHWLYKVRDYHQH